MARLLPCFLCVLLLTACGDDNSVPEPGSEFANSGSKPLDSRGDPNTGNGLGAGTYYFAVTAFNAELVESEIAESVIAIVNSAHG